MTVWANPVIEGHAYNSQTVGIEPVLQNINVDVIQI